jgi:hypothetical protein
MKRELVQLGKTNSAILNGSADLSLWSEEELIRGQRRSANGKFQGRPPKVVPKALHDELVARKMTQAYNLLNESIYDAVAVLREVALDKDADGAVRIKAATEILNRTMGKPSQEMKLSIKSQFDEVFEAMIVPDDDYVLDAVSWEDDG